MKKYVIVNGEKQFNLSILNRYINAFNVNDDTLEDLISCPKEDKKDVLEGNIYLPDTRLRGLYEYFCVKNYDELYNKLENRINIKQKIDTEDILIIDGYVFDEKEYDFIHLYYKYLSKEEKEKLANKLNINVESLTRIFSKILNGKAYKNVFIELLKEYNLEKLSELKRTLEEITKINRQKRALERNLKKENIYEVMEDDNMKQKIYNKTLELAINKFKKYNIDIKVLEELLNSLNDKEYDEEIQITFDFNSLIEKYIIEEIRKENIDYQIILIEENKALKSMLLKNEKYKCFDIDKLYEDAVEEMIQNYDPSMTISKNILINLKNIILEYKNVSSKQNDEEIKEENEVENNDNEMNDEKINEIENNKTFEKNDDERELIISLANKYITETKMSKINFSKKIKVNRVQVINYLNKKQNSKVVPKAIMNYFDVKTVDELQEVVNRKINEYYEQLKNDNAKNIIINLTNKYITETKMSKATFSKKIGVSRVPLICYLNNTKNSKTVPAAILKYFNAKSVDELEEKVVKKINEDVEVIKTQTQEIVEVEEDKNVCNYQEINVQKLMTILEKYLKETNISRNDFAFELGISKVSIDRYFAKENISQKGLKKILNYFNAESIEEVEVKINEKIIEYKQAHKDDITDDEILSLLKKYIENTNMTRNDFAKEINISKVSLDRYFAKTSNMSSNTYNNILEYFNAKTADELEEKINQKIEEYNLKNKIELPETKEVINCNTIEIKTENKNISTNNDILKLVNIDILNNLLDELLNSDAISKEEYIISWFLFGRNKGIFYSKEKISEFLNINIEYINDVYITSLRVYKKYFDSMLENATKLELGNSDIN